MQILLTHLTRMTHGFICAAGIDLQTGRHVRPLPRFGRLDADALNTRGGMLALGAVLELGPARPIGKPPEVEDHEIDAHHCRAIATEPAGRFWDRIAAASRTSLSEIFGAELRARGTRSCATDQGCGSASLGYLRPATAPRVSIAQRSNQGVGVRIQVGDGSFELNLSLADVRVHTGDKLMVNPAAVEQVRRMLDQSPSLLAVGLSRAHSVSPDSPPLHWLQVNNIFFESDPLWTPPGAPA